MSVAVATNWRERATITVEETAPVLGLSRSSAYEAAKRGEIPTLKVGRRLLVPVARLRRLLGEIDSVNTTSPASNPDSPQNSGRQPPHVEAYRRR